MSNYRKTMADALREMYPINEDTVELDEAKYELYHKDFSSAMQHAYHVAKKHHGITIDPEEIDNKVATGPRKPSEGKTNTYRLKGDKGAVQIQVYNKGGSKPFELNMYKEEVELDENRVMERFKEKDSAPGITKMSDKRLKFFRKIPHGSYTKAEIEDEILRRKKTGDFVKHIDGIHDSFVEEVGFDKLPDMSDALRQVRMEEVGLDEAPRRPKAPKIKFDDIMNRGKKPKTYRVDIDGSRATVTAASEKMAIQKAMTQLKINKKIKPLPKATVKVVEETDLDEAINPKDKKVVDAFYDGKSMDGKMLSTDGKKLEKTGMGGQTIASKSGNKFKIVAKMDSKSTQDVVKYIEKSFPKNVIEEVELDEGKMSQLHQYIKDKKSAEEIAKLMKVDVKTIKALMSSYESTDGDDMSENGAYMEMLAAACGGGAPAQYMHYDPMDEGAAADARRAMSRDKDFSRRDSADDDTDATDDDVKGASKNIMMQMRKAQSLRGRFDVEFADGKKTKVSAGVAMAVQSKYNSLKKPADKEKFQARIGKSYKDMLKALKEELQPKKESILERMNRKIKEKNNG